MRTFWIQTLGCKVNQYESEQIATLLRDRGLSPSPTAGGADLHVVNTCSVTMQAASKSRQTIRRTTSLPVLQFITPVGRKVIATGCWATSNRAEAAAMRGVDAVLGHHDDVAGELNRLLDQWLPDKPPHSTDSLPQPLGDDGSMIRAGAAALQIPDNSRPQNTRPVKQKLAIGTHSLPLLGDHQDTRQRGLLKVQDGCDAHCSYCIIPQLRPGLWSKPVPDVVDEARRLVEAGHVELVLTGIFLGAYGQPTALRHRQPQGPLPLGPDKPPAKPIADLVTALCTQVPGLRRLRFSSLEPGDLTPALVGVMKSHPQIVPHFHLPLQSGSDLILKRMNRQYRRDDFLRMIDDVNTSFDRPAITTDIIVGFPGETDAEFDQTLEIVERAGFIHIHAFSFSPRPGTAAARWTRDFVRGPVVNDRITRLSACAIASSYEFRKQFLGQTVELLVEREKLTPSSGTPNSPSPSTLGEGRGEGSLRHGRSERYFDVWFEDSSVQTGDAVRVTIDRVTSERTWGHR